MNDTAEKRPKWMSAKISIANVETIDRERGVLHNAKVVTAGEAKGHYVSLDSEFVEKVAALGNSEKAGLKARFGHPNMCSTALGTFLGRWKGFTSDGETARASLYLSNSAHDTPNGDLYKYVLDMAESEPDMFGTSIVFTPGMYYKRNAAGEKVIDPYDRDRGDFTDEAERTRAIHEYRALDGPEYVECKDLHACDAVDEPAANDGLFSRWANESLAGQVTEFLDTHPDVYQIAVAHPDIAERFIQKYEEQKLLTGDKTMSANNAEETAAVVVAVAEPESLSKPTDAANLTAATTSGTELPDTGAGIETPDHRAEFKALVEEFGAEIAAAVFAEGGGRADALELKIQRLEEIVAERELAAAGGKVTKAGGNPSAVNPKFEDMFKSKKNKS